MLADANTLPKLSLPLVLKAPEQGSSVGIACVFEAAKLEAACAEVFAYESPILAERYIPGREFTVANAGRCLASCCGSLSGGRAL